MKYNDVLINFCERKLNPHRPEYINAFSALYIAAIGYYNLMKITKKSVCLSLIFWCICMNGISSFLYHWTSWYIFSLLDEYTMIIPLWIGVVKILYDLNYSTYWIGMISLYNILLLVSDIFIWFDYFPHFFALELLFIIPLYYQVYIEYNQSHNIIIRKYALFSNNGFKGIVICSVSGMIWIITELNCNKYLIFGHAIWHIGMSNGLCRIIQYFSKQTKQIKLIKNL